MPYDTARKTNRINAHCFLVGSKFVHFGGELNNEFGICIASLGCVKRIGSIIKAVLKLAPIGTSPFVRFL